jgi:polyphosphate glucokinase
VISAIESLVKNFTVFDKISVGFPGYVKDGIVFTAPNLDQETWAQVNLSEQLNIFFGKPARVINDAELLALGVVKGKGLEMLITLGTGFGTALLKDGMILPHVELAHHPITKHKSYDDYIGAKAFKLAGIIKLNWHIIQ